MLANIVQELTTHVSTQRNTGHETGFEYWLMVDFYVRRKSDVVSLKFKGQLLGYKTPRGGRIFPTDGRTLFLLGGREVFDSVKVLAQRLLEGTSYEHSFDNDSASVSINVSGSKEQIDPEIAKIKELLGEPNFESSNLSYNFKL